jgi:hypothetical protein
MRPLFHALVALLILLASGAALAEEGPPGTEIHPAAEEPGHLPPDVEHDYGTPFPTSGPHSIRGTQPNFYWQPQPPTELVHALEHGHVVIYYDAPGEEVLGQLLALTHEHAGEKSALVVVPSPGIGEEIVLTAWERRLMLSEYDPAKARDFIAAFLGRHSEHMH